MDTCRILISTLLASFLAVNTYASDINVKPGAYTIEKALQQAREEKRLNGTGNICIRLSEGTYRLNQPIIVRPEDNGIKIISDGKAVISGGVRITGWKKQGRCYVADVPEFNGRPLEFRQLYVNGVKAVRARDVEDFNDMFRITNIDKSKEVLYVPSKAVRKILNAPYAEMVIHEMWCIANLRIKGIKLMGDSAEVSFHQPESHIHFMHPWPSPMITQDGHNSAFYLTNAKELLDKEGEWFLDTKASKVYYIPRKGENMNNADVEVPAVETLLKVEGTPDNMVKDVTFEGIEFAYSTWMRPSISGHAPLQAGMYMIEAYKLRPKMIRPNGDHKLDNQGWVGRPAAAVSINCAENVVFNGCTFNHLASTGIDYHNYIKGGTIERCTLKDIGGNGILAGSFGPEAHEAHLPYNPSDTRIICTGLSICNNTITDVTNEDWGCVGIGAGFVKDIKICHNEISEVSYTGISMGWGWNQQVCSMSNNLVEGNLIHHYAKHMYDTAGIYTLGSQPHSFIQNNVVRDIYSPSYAHDPHHWFYLYTDEGSSCITVRNNWTPTEKYLKNANGPCNIWENNGPAVADSIKAKAGIIR
ncbi:MAG: right-handed parallel beta-helix repeat-containing protein [Prevotella sp.]